MAEEMKDLLQNNAPENAEAVTESAAEGTENAERPKISMPAKEDILYEVDVHMNTSVLYDYMLRHTYTSPGGLIATIIGVFAILFAMKNAGVLYLIAGIVIILYLPWNLYLSAKRQALTNEAFKKPLHYIFTKEGIYVSQGDQVEMQHWENMHQAVATGKSIIYIQGQCIYIPACGSCGKYSNGDQADLPLYGSEKGKDPSVKIGMSATTAYTDVVNCGIL